MEDREGTLLEVQKMLDRLCTGVEHVKEKQEEMTDAITKIKDAVYNPDEGLYARIRALESWKSTSSRMLWTLFTTVIGLIGALILKSMGAG